VKVLLICLLICLLLVAYIKLSKVEQSIWHLDPDSITNVNINNSFLLNYANKGTKTFNLEVNALFNILNNIIINDNCEKVFGDINLGLITYVCRSKVFGFPDYVSINFKNLGINKSSLSIFSRSRFGRNDFGKNKQRIQEWLTELKKSV
tara:strand:+ start:2033 stop:2479 length:447 start_codon:yes stop_codon:yes gene_type:complete